MRRLVEQCNGINRLAGWIASQIRYMYLMLIMLVVVLVFVYVDYLFSLHFCIRLGILFFVVVGGVYVVRKNLQKTGSNKSFDAAIRNELFDKKYCGQKASKVNKHRRDTYESIRQLLGDKVDDSIECDALFQVLNLRRFIKIIILFLLVISLIAIVCMVKPRVSAIALSRWILPVSGYEWPKKVVVDDVTKIDVFPLDKKINIKADVYSKSKNVERVYLNYRVLRKNGSDVISWEKMVLNAVDCKEINDVERKKLEQVDNWENHKEVYKHVYQVCLKLMEKENSWENHGGHLEYWIETRDDYTDIKRVELIERPKAEKVLIEVIPADYASPYVESRVMTYDETKYRKISGRSLEGSLLIVKVLSNKKLNTKGEGIKYLGDTVREFERNNEREYASRVRLINDIKDEVLLHDKYGFQNLSRIVVDWKVEKDELPRVFLGKPEREVVATKDSVVDVSFVANDDIAVEYIDILVEVERSDEIVFTKRLGKEYYQNQYVKFDETIDLQKIGVEVGDKVEICACVRDVYLIEGKRHPEVVSKKIQFVVFKKEDVAALLQKEFMSIYRAVEDIKEKQEKITIDDTNRLINQNHITEDLNHLNSNIKKIRQRIINHRLGDDELFFRYEKISGYTKKAISYSKDIELEKEAAPDDVLNELQKLIVLLTKNMNFEQLQKKLMHIYGLQKVIAEETQEMLTGMVGEKQDERSDEQHKLFHQMSKREENLAHLAMSMLEQMEVTVEVLGSVGKGGEKTNIDVLRRAKTIAQRGGLTESMQNAAEYLRQSRKNEASSAYACAMSVIQQMLSAMNQSNEIQSLLLQRELKKLVELLEQLVMSHERELEIIKASGVSSAVESRISKMRRKTILVEEIACREEKFSIARQYIAAANMQQAEAILVIREKDQIKAEDVEEKVINNLKKAIGLIQVVMNDEEQNMMNDKRKELKDLYFVLASKQREIVIKTESVIEGENTERAKKIEGIKIANGERVLLGMILELGNKIQNYSVFEYEHRQIIKKAKHVISEFHEANISQKIVLEQKEIAESLELMADVLAEQIKSSEFIGNRGGGDSGLGMGDKGQVEMIPLVAELKLLRELQKKLNVKTKGIHDQLTEDDSEWFELQVRLLSKKQKDIAGLGAAMMDKLKNTESQIFGGRQNVY